MKVGDKLYCYDNKNCMDLTIGNIYTVLRISEHSFDDSLLFQIKNNNNNIITFTINKDKNGISYKNWFKYNTQIRKIKLKQLNLLNI